MLQGMSELCMSIGGTEVRFPGGRNPYGVQKSIMLRVIQAADAGSNALISAPTGCGKTLSLLAASLSWLEKVKESGVPVPVAQRGALTPGGFIVDASNGSPQPQQQQRTKPPRIIYASRTHTQVAQVIAELRSMTMSPSAVTLAARQHYCIHKTASQARDVNHECLRLLSDESPATCFHYRQAEGLAQHLRGEVLDIEDLVTEGRQHGGCPYFAAKELSATADITLCPYNYVMCPEVRKAMGLEVEGAVVIIDEAHNIEHVAMDAGSFSASITALEIATKVLDDAATYADPAAFGPISQAFAELVRYLKAAVAPLEKTRKGATDGVAKRWPIGLGGLLDDIMGMGFGECESFKGVLETVKNDSQASGERRRRKRRAGRGDRDRDEAFSIKGAEQLGPCSEFLNCLSLVIGRSSPRAKGGQIGENNARHYSAALQYSVSDKQWQFHLWCLWPGVIFRPLSEMCRSVILASGTLSPLDSMEAELGAPFPFRLDGAHVVGRDNVLAAVVPWGPGGERFEWTYGQRGSLALPDALGETLLRAVGVVPRGSGVLVFFPSYSMMATVAKRLQATGVLGRLREAAWVGEEARERGAEDAVTQFRESVRRGRTAVLMAPARGKVSEGMDFRDDECRLVLQVGIPFPNARDAKVVLKKEYNNANGRDMGLPSGDEWYTMQAFRALNQCIGRCIRHIDDYGAVIFLDARYERPDSRYKLSGWVQRSLSPSPSHAIQALESLREFYVRVKAASDASREARAKLEATRSLQAYLDRIGLLRLGASGSAEWERFLGAIPDEMTSDIISAD